MSDKDMEIKLKKYIREILNLHMYSSWQYKDSKKKEGGPYYVWCEYFRLQKKDFNLKFNILYLYYHIEQFWDICKGYKKYLELSKDGSSIYSSFYKTELVKYWWEWEWDASL